MSQNAHQILTEVTEVHFRAVQQSTLPSWMAEAYDYYPHMSPEIIEAVESTNDNGDPLDGVPL